jgi:hypothetical protein
LFGRGVRANLGVPPMFALSRSVLLLSTLIALGALGACSPNVARCAVTCGAEQSCPSGAMCGGDGFCHQVSAASEIVECTAAELDAGLGVDDDAGDDAGAVPVEPMPCEGAHVLVAVGDALGRADGGKIIRLRFDEDGEPSRCSDVTGRGTLGADVTAVAHVTGAVAAATQSELVLIDAATDEVIWRTPYPALRVPVDVFRVSDGRPLIAVAFLKPTSISEIGLVELYD